MTARADPLSPAGNDPDSAATGPDAGVDGAATDQTISTEAVPETVPEAVPETGPEGVAGTVSDDVLLEAGRKHVAESNRISEEFFRDAADAVALTCWEMAKRFHRGGRLLVIGSGASRSDALHVSVEFVHPVLVGKRALPALVVGGDPAPWISTMGAPGDIALGIHPGFDASRSGGRSGAGERIAHGMRAAGAAGLLTIALTGSEVPADLAACDHLHSIPSDDPGVIQEVQETLYHVLWELVHVFFEHRGLL